MSTQAELEKELADLRREHEELRLCYSQAVDAGEHEQVVRQRDALLALARKVTRVGNSQEFTGVFQIAEMHHCPYQGETWASELAEVQRVVGEQLLADRLPRYVVGFLFRHDNVVLIKKAKPERHCGLWNGPGGKVEPGETPLQAMTREFLEETGIEMRGWDEFAVMTFRGCVVHFYWLRDDSEDGFVLPAPPTQEETALVSVSDAMTRMPLVPNLDWLLPLALAPDRVRVVATEPY